MNLHWKKNPDLATTVTIGNQKGGVSKTTTACLLGYSLSKKGIKTLVIDLDPQSNATKLLMLTHQLNNTHVNVITKTLMRGVQEGSLNDLPIKIIDNLFLLPSFIDFEDFPKYIYKTYTKDMDLDFVLKKLIDPLKKHFDIILIDVPPMNIEITKNAVISSDYVLIALQTQERSLTGAENYINKLLDIKEKYSLNLEVLGVLAVLQKNNGKVDKYIMEKAIEQFGQNNMFNTIIPQMERIKRFDVNGISNDDFHDQKVLQLYHELSLEFLNRLSLFKGAYNE